MEVAAPKQELSFADRFNQFKKQSEQKYLSFRQECNKQYTDFVRQGVGAIWRRASREASRRAEGGASGLSRHVGHIEVLILRTQEKEGQSPGDEATARAPQRPEPVEPIERVALSEEETEYGSMPFVFFGNELSVHLDETKRFNIGEINPNRIADILLYLSGLTYDNPACDCLALRDKHQLCDWAYLLMLKGITDQFCGADTNESALLLGYLYYQSGYKIRFASDDNDHLYLLVASNDVIYDKPSYVINGEKFYPVHDVDVALNICTAKFPKESNLSLRIDKAIEFDKMATEVRTITSERFPDLHIDVAVNKNLIDFYNEYPSSYTNNDIYTFWAIYADTPMNEDVKTQIYPALREYIKGKSEAEAVGSLLNLVQTGLEYKFDKEVWGVEDRAFFAEETLFLSLLRLRGPRHPPDAPRPRPARTGVRPHLLSGPHGLRRPFLRASRWRLLHLRREGLHGLRPDLYRSAHRPTDARLCRQGGHADPDQNKIAHQHRISLSKQKKSIHIDRTKPRERAS